MPPPITQDEMAADYFSDSNEGSSEAEKFENDVTERIVAPIAMASAANKEAVKGKKGLKIAIPSNNAVGGKVVMKKPKISLQIDAIN